MRAQREDAMKANGKGRRSFRSGALCLTHRCLLTDDPFSIITTMMLSIASSDEPGWHFIEDRRR